MVTLMKANMVAGDHTFRNDEILSIVVVCASSFKSIARLHEVKVGRSRLLIDFI
ncbi:MAG: hypothetical protein BWY75_03849 [bacterium ADurb.Bin425]|nr:MAG: hypothetical protein BWY75_03849 [bacterium ADurb.Bin425]